MTDYKGFHLFNDIEDNDLRNRNRATTLANIASDYSRDRRISANGAGLILGYFNQVPEEDKSQVNTLFVNEMKLRGFHIVSNRP